VNYTNDDHENDNIEDNEFYIRDYHFEEILVKKGCTKNQKHKCKSMHMLYLLFIYEI